MKDPRSEQFNEVKKKEILDLKIEKCTFKVVLREDAYENTDIIPSRFFVTIQNEGINEEILKARFALGENIEKDKKSIVQNATTLKQYSVRILLALAAIYRLDKWIISINKAY